MTSKTKLVYLKKINKNYTQKKKELNKNQWISIN